MEIKFNNFKIIIVFNSDNYLQRANHNLLNNKKQKSKLLQMERKQIILIMMTALLMILGMITT